MTHKKQRTKNKEQKFRGYTLIELLAVITLLGAVGTITFGILLSSLRGSNKSESVTTLQQNGNYALSVMSRMIRFSQKITDPASCYSGPTPTPVQTTQITIQNLDGNTTTFSCDGMPDGSIASNGASLIDTSATSVTSCSFTCMQATNYAIPSVTIDFTLNKKNSNNLTENNSPTHFQTTVTLRNLSN